MEIEIVGLGAWAAVFEFCFWNTGCYGRNSKTWHDIIGYGDGHISQNDGQQRFHCITHHFERMTALKKRFSVCVCVCGLFVKLWLFFIYVYVSNCASTYYLYVWCCLAALRIHFFFVSCALVCWMFLCVNLYLYYNMKMISSLLCVCMLFAF